MPQWDEHQLRGLVQHLGKEIARQPEAPEKVAALERVESPRELRAFVETLETERLRLEPPAREAVLDYMTDEDHWRDRVSTLKRAAEESLENRFTPSS